MKLARKVGATSQILQVFIRDSSSTTGAGLTGLTSASSGLTGYYHRDTDTTATAISLVTMTVGTFTSSGFKEIDATNMPGWYQFCPPNLALASGAASVGVHLKGATNMAPLPIEIDLDAQVDVALWNGTAVASPATAGIPEVNIKNINNVSTSAVTTVKAVQGLTTADTIATYTGNTPQTGDAYARLGAPAGASVSADIAAVNAKTTNLPSSPASTTNITGGTITTVTNLTNAPTAGDFTATMKTSIGTAVAASAVASVTGNVGGNVTGSVGSVVAAVAITSNRKKASGSTFEFLMQDSTTGAPKTGLTITSTISKDGGSAASTANSVTEIGLGQYQIVLTGTEMTANNIFLQFTSTGAITANLSIQTQP